MHSFPNLGQGRRTVERGVNGNVAGMGGGIYRVYGANHHRSDGA